MHVVTRTYSGRGAKELFDIFDANKAEIEHMMRAISGFVSYSMVRTATGGFSISVFDTKAGSEESVKAAREFVARNASHIGANPPTVVEGTAILQVQ